VRYLLLAAKIALSVTLVVYAFSRIDTATATLQMRSISAYAVLAAGGLLFFQFSIAAFRLREVLEALGARCRFFHALDVVFVGAFFSQTLISFIGGDAMRVWRIVRSNVPLALATKAVVLDRALGLAGTLALVLLTVPFLLEVVREPTMRSGFLIALIGGIAGFVTVVSMGYLAAFRKFKLLHWVSEFARVTLLAVWSAKRLASLLALSLIIQLLNVITLYVLALGLSINITFWHSLLLVPPVLFLSMLPISVAGWGVREGAMIVALGLVGVPPARSVALSVCFGLSLIAISLPGGVLWLLQRGHGIPPDPDVGVPAISPSEPGRRSGRYDGQ
jgi:uncharacterized membrane protein YbhN (UPF0104 family)